MRTNASIEEWGRLYESATRIKEMKPWDYLWDLDIVGILTGDNPEDTVFYSILGKGGTCLGITVYEGYDALNSFFLLTMQDVLNVSTEYAMFNQQCLSCYWGDREELSAKQRKIIRELGYKYRGKGNWLYFMSFEPGYYPFEPDRDEVLRMTEHLENFEKAFACYLDEKIQIDFENGNMFSFVFSDDKKSRKFGEEPLPFSSYNFGNLIITDKEMLTQLREAPHANAVLELEIIPLGVSVADKKYDRPINMMAAVIADAKSGTIISCKMAGPDEDVNIVLVNELLAFIDDVGAPREILVSNVILEAVIEQICDICGIKRKKVRRLKATGEFFNAMKHFGRHKD
ncbi:MAG: hypothetical protein LUE96_11955 [Lachnospiraceae bacterium]|nr:hypothetical protein [Lachnospiraceae bacterium]